MNMFAGVRSSLRRRLGGLVKHGAGRRVSARLLVVILIVGLASVGFGLTRAFQAQQRSQAQVDLTTDVLGLLRQSLRAGLDAETGQRGFLLTLDERYLRPFERGQRTWLGIIGRIRDRLGDRASETQRAALDRMEVLARAKLVELARTVDLARAGDRAGALAIVASGEGQDLLNEYRQLVARLEGAEESILRNTLAEVRAADQRTAPLLAALFVAIIALLLVSLWLDRRAARSAAVAQEAEVEREARAQAELVARELNHRVKNLFTVVLSIVGLVGRQVRDPDALVEGIRSRIQALARAHDVTQGTTDSKSVDLRDLLKAALAPYRVGRGERVVLRGPSLALSTETVTPIGLLLHELATNAAKYGALSVEDGTVTIGWQVRDICEDEAEPDVGERGGAIVLDWVESGGPPVEHNGAAGGSRGFGTRMMESTARQLHGTLTSDFRPDGLRFQLRFPAPEA